MIQPTTRSAWPIRQADLATGPVTCATCGCRLKVDAFEETWRHFPGRPVVMRAAAGSSASAWPTTPTAFRSWPTSPS